MFRLHGYSGPCPKPPMPKNPEKEAAYKDLRIAALEADLAAKEAECERLRMDAERYRWLRDQKNDDGIVIAMKNKHIDDLLPYSVNIDRYIDAARKEGT